MGAPATAVALTGADQAIATGPTLYRGYAIRETAGATAAVRIFDGTSAAGTLLDVVALAANGAAAQMYDGCGLRASTGVYVDVVSGTVEGSVRIG